MNYIISAGGGFEHRPNAKPQVHTLTELAEQFRIGRVNSHPSRLNSELLNDYNQLEIKRRLSGEQTRLQLVALVQQLVKQAYPKQ